MKTMRSIQTLASFTAFVSLAVNAYCQSLTDGLVARYPFNGNANDVTENGNNGTVYGATLVGDRFGQAISAYSFDGNSNYIEVADSPSLSILGDITISAWIEVEDYVTYRSIVSKSIAHLPAPCDFYIHNGVGAPFADAGDPALCRGDGSSHWWRVCGATAISTGVWQHVAVTMQGTTVKHYLNGTANGTGTLVTTIADADGTMRIGGRDDMGSRMKGCIDDVRIYNRALSPTEIEQLFQSEFMPQADLVKAVKPVFKNLTIGNNYQLEVSSDITNWTNEGMPFSATNSTMVYPQYWDVDNWNQLFFRVQVAP